ncbi:tetratricopeptide repeat protein [Deminuibacter soli]|uniref:Tetratricopeptide repeat protein n=1 Tax=Deminuibacter soli TaxID=2291815 RepID=A0A3E1NGZ5_9BACT|nr:tetratricopeptide repeat protein [Deminuibacter soli]RFM27220.1 tetratricopeptide repeat protein [Deminuibacter soli]
MKQRYVPFIFLCIFFACNNGKTKEKQPGTTAQAIGCYSPPVTDKAWYTAGKKAPLFAGLKGIDFTITTNSQEAQTYFNQGMMLAYGFNHAEAARSFYEITRLDSTCAMGYWGFAYVLGPNYNAGMEKDNFERAYAAVVKAQALAATCTAKEKALIAALAARYAANPTADRSALDIAYAAAMKQVYIAYPDDPDVGALYAEALMDLHPWDLYDKQTKQPRPWTPELLATLTHLMTVNPQHPGAHHFYIHALEASATPEKALASARLLDTLVTGAGHLLHMPSHIYINTGDYHAGSVANIRALAADSTYTTACHAQGAYPLAYYPHNYHFLAATATLEGNWQLAWHAAKQLQQQTPVTVMHMPGWGTLQHYYTIPYYISARFGMWDTVLAVPAPPQDLVYVQAMWHYARGMAFFGKNDATRAQKELGSLETLAADTSLQHLTVWNINTTADLVQIAVKVLRAEAAARQKQLPAAIALLKEAVALEDKLNYNEPPDWFFSVRHYLGAVLVKAGKYAEAATVYRQDLQVWRKNGWALIGLYHALTGQGKHQEAQQVKLAFDQAWQYADVHITSSAGIID